MSILRSTGFATLAYALLTIAAPRAMAESLEFMELQIELEALVSAVSDRLGNDFETRFCPLQADEPLCFGQPCVLDRLAPEPTNAALRRNGFQLTEIEGLLNAHSYGVELVMPVRAFFKTAACAEDPTCPFETYARQIVANAIIGLTVERVEAEGAPDQYLLCFEPKGIEPEAFNDPAITAELANYGQCVRLAVNDFDPGPTGRVAGVGISTDGNGARLALRIEYLSEIYDALSPNETAAHDFMRGNAWDDFLAGTLAPAVTDQPSDWRLFISGSSFENGLRRRLKDGIAHAHEDISPGLPVTASWFMAPEDGQVTSHTSVEIYQDLCVNDITAYLDGTYIYRFEDRRLMVDGRVDIDLDDIDTFLCGFLMPGMGIINLATSGFIVEALADSLPLPADLAEQIGSEECTAELAYDVPETQVGEHVALSCGIELPVLTVPGADDATLEPVGATPTMFGLTIFGDLVVPSRPAHQPVLAEAVMSYGVQGGCGSLHVGYDGYVRVRNARTCGIYRRGDVHEVFGFGPVDADPYLISTWDIVHPTLSSLQCMKSKFTLPQMVQCAPGTISKYDFYFNSPYPLNTTVKTRRGMISPPPVTPPTVSPAQQEAAMIALIEAESICMAPQQGWLGNPGGYNPSWDIDPPNWMGGLELGGVEVGQGVVQALGIGPEFLVHSEQGEMLQLQVNLLVETGRLGFEALAFAAISVQGWTTEFAADGSYVVRLSSPATEVEAVVVDGDGLIGASAVLPLEAGAISILYEAP
ncbi:MAG: hypothetical protein H6730_34545 [Deltaproteobacteria bacterium]|nr:hypothetical protein [Deltaproteobacteria bacterium]